MKYLLLLSLACLVYAIEIDQSKVCSCNEMTYQNDCNLAGGCDWTNGGCTLKNCPAGKGYICSIDPNGTLISTSSITIPTLSQCSTYNYQSCRDGIFCTVSNRICRTLQCSDFFLEKLCIYTFSDDFKKLILCNWINQSCVEATSLSGYDASTCYQNTGRLATWYTSTNQCTECKGQLNSLILVLGLLNGFMI